MHQERICFCPPGLPAGYFWYGKRRHSPGRPPRWVQQLLEKGADASFGDPDTSRATAESVIVRDPSSFVEPANRTAESVIVREPVTHASLVEPANLTAESVIVREPVAHVSFVKPANLTGETVTEREPVAHASFVEPANPTAESVPVCEPVREADVSDSDPDTEICCEPSTVKTSVEPGSQYLLNPAVCLALGPKYPVGGRYTGPIFSLDLQVTRPET